MFMLAIEGFSSSFDTIGYLPVGGEARFHIWHWLPNLGYCSHRDPSALATPLDGMSIESNNNKELLWHRLAIDEID